MIQKLNSVVAGLVLAGVSAIAHAQDLQQVYQLALDNDPTVLRAEAQFKSSQESIKQARSVLLPQLNGTATISDSEREINGQPFSEPQSTELALALNMQLYHHNSWVNLGIAEKNAHRFDINYQFVKQQLITRVTEAYFNVLAAYDGLEFAKAEKAARMK